MTYPQNITPGQVVEIKVDTVGLPGGAWYSFYGHADCKVYDYVLEEKTLDIPKTNLISLTVPIGENVVQTASSDEILVYLCRKDVNILVTKYYVEARMRFKFDFEVITSTYVTGNVSIGGNAIDSPINKDHIWGPTFKRAIQISPTAQPGNTLDMSVTDMKYVLHKVNLRVKMFHVYVGYYSDISIIGNEPNAIVKSISVEEFSPTIGTRSDTNAKGDFINTFGEEPIISDLQASVSVPYPPPESGSLGGIFKDVGSGTGVIIVIIIVAAVAIVAYVTMRKSRNSMKRRKESASSIKSTEATRSISETVDDIPPPPPTG